MQKLKVISITPRYPRYAGSRYQFIQNVIRAISPDTQLALLSIVFEEKMRSSHVIDVSNEHGYTRIDIKLNKKLQDSRTKTRLYRAIYEGYKQGVKKLHGKPDLVHINLGSSAISLRTGRFVSSITRVPYVISEYFSTFTDAVGVFEKYDEKTRNYFRKAFANADALVSPSLYLMEQLYKRGLNAARNEIIPIPVDIPAKVTYPPVPPPFKLVTVCNLVDWIKNIKGLIKAVKIVSEKREVQLYIIGAGPDEQTLKDYAYLLGLLDRNVFFLGTRKNTEVFDIINSSHIFVLNSNFETFSLATAEALACGRPVVVTKSGGPEDFVNERCGVLVSPGNPEELASALMHVMDNYTSYDFNAIQSHARETFSAELVAKRYLELFNEIKGLQ